MYNLIEKFIYWQYCPLASLILIVIAFMLLGLFLNSLDKDSRLEDATDEFMSLKNWDNRKDGIK